MKRKLSALEEIKNTQSQTMNQKLENFLSIVSHVIISCLELKIYNVILPVMDIFSQRYRASFIDLIKRSQDQEKYLLLKIIAIIHDDYDNINFLCSPYCFEFWLKKPLQQSSLSEEEFLQKYDPPVINLDDTIIKPYLVYEMITRAIYEYQQFNELYDARNLNTLEILDFLLNTQSFAPSTNEEIKKALHDFLTHCLTPESAKIYCRKLLITGTKENNQLQIKRLIAEHIDLNEIDSTAPLASDMPELVNLLDRFLVFLDKIEEICTVLRIPSFLNLIASAVLENNSLLLTLDMDNKLLPRLNTALNLAIKSQHMKFIHCFSYQGANLELQDKEGNTALMCASNMLPNKGFKFHQLISLLLDCGANISNLSESERRDLIKNGVVYIDLVDAILAPHGLISNNVAGDGNCFFSAMAIHLGIDAGEIRAQAIQHIRDNPQIYQGFIEQNLEEFLQLNSQNGQWADHPMIQATANAYQIRIVIYDLSGGNTEINPVNEDLSTIEATIFYTGNHYLCVLRANDEDTDSISIFSANDVEEAPPEQQNLDIPSSMPTFFDSDATINELGSAFFRADHFS
jgi:ankyrin repeat protein